MTRRTAPQPHGGRRPAAPLRSFIRAASARYVASIAPVGEPAIAEFVVRCAVFERYGPAVALLATWVRLAMAAGADPRLARRLRAALHGGSRDGLADELARVVPLAHAVHAAGWEIRGS